MSTVAEVITHCDSCGINSEGQPVSRAQVHVVMLSGELAFCGHHFSANEDILRAQALEVRDERE